MMILINELIVVFLLAAFLYRKHIFNSGIYVCGGLNGAMSALVGGVAPANEQNVCRIARYCVQSLGIA